MPPTSALALSRKASAYRIKSHTSVWVFGINPAMGFTRLELVVVIFVVAILAFLGLPVFTSVSKKGPQAVDLSNARQVGLGLRLYASDHNGIFPTATKSANVAFLQIMPKYVPSQKIFFLADSGWCTGSHPVEADPSGTLAAGQNNFAYVTGLEDSDNTNYPLVADGFNEGAPGVYNPVKGTKGGVWKGTKAIVIRVDDSGMIEKVATSDYRVYSNQPNSYYNGANPTGADIFTTSATWMPSGVVLNPE